MFPVPAHGKGKIHAQVWDITSKPPSQPSSPTAPSSPSADAPDLASLSLDGEKSASTSSDRYTTASPQSFSLPFGLKPNSVDVLTVIYVLSALHPTEWDQAIHNLYTVSAALHTSRWQCHDSRRASSLLTCELLDTTLTPGTQARRNSSRARLRSERSRPNPDQERPSD